MAAAGHFNFETVFDAQMVALLGLKDGDNPDDLQAAKDGWKAYWVSNGT